MRWLGIIGSIAYFAGLAVFLVCLTIIVLNLLGLASIKMSPWIIILAASILIIGWNVMNFAARRLGTVDNG